MNDRFSEHFRIDQYLRNKSRHSYKANTLKRSENILSNFPVGLIIITKEDLKLEERVEFINQYACRLFKVRETVNVKELKEKFNQFIKLKTNNNAKSKKTLYDIIFSYSSFNLELDNFIPFECTYSNSIILYIKINEINNEKYIVIDKYDKYNEERKNIELNLIKTINYQYLHTLYHELNNPLNALLAISGEKERPNIFSSEITNSKVDDKPTITQKRSLIKRRKSNSILNRKNSNNNRVGLGQEIFDKHFKKKNTIEDVYLNDKIPLLVNIIKIFIKNFILYLKIKTDSVLRDKKKLGNDTSDIMSAVEPSEYEKELTKHQRVKINLEYVLDLYLEKFGCLFNYKEIDYETNFEKLRDVYVITEEFTFIYYIRQIYTFLYYVVPKKEGFIFDYEEGNEINSIKIIIRKKNNGEISRRTAEPLGFNHKDNIKSKDSKDDVSQVIQTKEMTKEVLYALSKKLGFLLEIYEAFDKNNDNTFLSITMPIQMKDKSEEEDEFKDYEISEMIQKHSFLLEDKLKRQFPTCENLERKKSNCSINYESSFENQVTEMNVKNIKNVDSKNNKKKSEKKLNNLTINIKKESQKKVIFNHKLNEKHNFLKNCLKISEVRKKENSKNNRKPNPKRKRKSLNIINLNSSNKINSNVKLHLSHKNCLYNSISHKNNMKLRDTQLTGVFTKINNFGLSEELDCNDLSISNITGNKKNSRKDLILLKNERNPKNSSKSNIIQDNTKRPSNFNLEMNERTQLSTNNKSPTNRVKNSKLKSSYIITDVIEGDNKNINISINNNNIINIINDNSNGEQKQNIENNLNNNNNDNNNNNGNDNNHQEKKIKDLISSTKIFSSNKENNNMKLPEIDKSKQKRLSQNASPKINTKDCMTFFEQEKKEKVSRDKHTFANEGTKHNKSLFLDANKEGEFNLHSESNNNNNNMSNANAYEEEEEEEDDDDEKEENSCNCNCLDILIVDDEEFNVMASQKMIKNLGYESDKAYNGEECINLIKEKQKLNCKCNKNYYKIIFLDIVMPVLDGIKAAKKIEEMIDNKEINENTQIVFVSGNIDGNDLKNSLLKIKCVKECLQKPVKIDRYQKILEKYYK
jgi:CheY-like chemotaxis protein